MLRVLAFLCVLPSSALAADLVAGGRVDQVVATGSLVAVVRGAEVRVLSHDGRPLFHLDLSRPPPPVARLHHEDDEVLELHGIPEEDHDEAYAEDLIDDESSLRSRDEVRASVPASVSRALLAASDDRIFIAIERTLWRVDPDGRAGPVATLPAILDHLAASPDGRIWAAGGGRIWRADAGTTFALAAEPGPVRALAAGRTGVAWWTGAELVWSDDGGTHARALGGVHDLRFCGDALVALQSHGLSIFDGEETRAAHPPGAHRLACAARGPWLLAGPGLAVSNDEGRSFLERSDLPPANVLGAAVADDGLWLATTSGLYRVTMSSGPPMMVAGSDDDLPRLVRADRAGWSPLLPRLVLAASAVTTAGRRDLRTVAYADFPLGARPPALHRLAQVDVPAIPPPVLPALPPAPLPLDREASCLPVARGEAVALALVEPDRARSYVTRAGRAAWLPELRVRVDRRLGRSESLDLPAGSSVPSGPLGLDTANDVRYEARATWDLSKLVFSAEEVAAASQALRMSDTRREIESLVNRLYFERRRLKLESAPSADTRARRELRVQEIEAELDALSGGAFSHCLPAPP